MKALFPISVDSKRFNSDETLFALNNIKEQYEEIIFLIADGLQLYNKATLVEKGNSLTQIFSAFESNNFYFLERERWLNNLKNKVDPKIRASKWSILNIDLITDNKYHSIYRNVLVSYFALKSFKDDIIHAAKAHRSRLTSEYSKYDLELSVAYIIEEIAVNLRLRVIDRIGAEYYIGEQLPPLINLYDNKYEVDVFTMCGLEKEIFHFEFFNLLEKNSSWIVSSELQST